MDSFIMMAPDRKDYENLTRKELIELRQKVMKEIMAYEDKYILDKISLNQPCDDFVFSTIDAESMYFWNTHLLNLLSELIEDKRQREIFPFFYEIKVNRNLK